MIGLSAQQGERLGGALMHTRPPVPLEHSRLFTGAHLRRWMVYALAGLLVVVVATLAVNMARPPDPNRTVSVVTLPGLDSPEQARTTGVGRDPQTGTTTIYVRGSDGVIRRYFVQPGEGGTTIWGGNEAPPGQQR